MTERTEALFRAAVEEVVEQEHGGHAVAHLILARYLSSEFWPKVVEVAVAMAGGTHPALEAAMDRHPAGRCRVDATLSAISAQVPTGEGWAP